MASRIEDYALLGDCESAALVDREGSIDWLCWPRFDSGAVFARLLGSDDNGHWSLTTKEAPAHVARRYRDNTLVLETNIATASGEVTVVDFMPLRKVGSSHLIRIVRGRHGCVEMRTRLRLRFDYGAIVPWVTREGDRRWKAIAGPDLVIFEAGAKLEAEGMTHAGLFTVAAGETVAFVLSYAPSFGPQPARIDALATLRETEAEWRAWAGTYTAQHAYSSRVLRSLITLKALTYGPTGGIVAAPTTSLPEQVGGERNWDYRYCWLRDATFTLLALINCGFYSEASAWRRWLRHAVAGNPAQVQIMYGLAGERRLDEWEIPWLAGYESARPVRIGNSAARQLQLDIFGEVLDALFQGQAAGLASEVKDWDLQRKLVEHLETVWRHPDEGFWEVRGGSRHFTHSKVMAWVAFDRAIKSVERFGVEGPITHWRQVRAAIHEDVCRHGYDAAAGAFVQSYGSSALDASALLIPLVGFLPPHDERVRSTVAKIGQRLRVDGLIRRYDPLESRDGLKGSEGAFLACSFWFADNLILLGRRDEAKELFEHLLTLCNDVGLLAEEYDPKARRMLGNFPQAFSHVALINTAHNLYRTEKPAEQRSEHRREPPISHPVQPLVEKPG